MAGPRKTSERSIGLLLLGALAFSPPLLFMFSNGRTAFGVPLLYVYLLAAWAALIVLAGVLAERAHNRSAERQRPPPRGQGGER